MEVFYYETPFPHVTIRDYYEEDELKQVWVELDFLTHSDKLNSPEKTFSAMNPDGTPRKKNTGVFLDSLYSNRKISNILNVSRKHFNPELLNVLCQQHFIFEYIRKSVSDSTLLSYYEESDNYLPHCDQSSITAVTWLFKEPKRFDGGNFTFDEYDYEIPLQNNFMVLFPGIMSHSVSPVKMEPGLEPFSGFGRYALSNFIQIGR